MKYKWIDKNVDLNSLTESIEHFLKDRRFTTLRENSGYSRQIVGIYRNADRRLMKVAVKVSGTPDSCVVELKAGERVRSILKLSSVVSFLGGGQFLLKGYESAEFYRKIEDEFWRYIENRLS